MAQVRRNETPSFRREYCAVLDNQWKNGNHKEHNSADNGASFRESSLKPTLRVVSHSHLYLYSLLQAPLTLFLRSHAEKSLLVVKTSSQVLPSPAFSRFNDAVVFVMSLISHPIKLTKYLSVCLGNNGKSNRHCMSFKADVLDTWWKRRKWRN